MENHCTMQSNHLHNIQLSIRRCTIGLLDDPFMNIYYLMTSSFTHEIKHTDHIPLSNEDIESPIS